MRKKVFFLVFALILVVFCSSVHAADAAYSFDITYTGNIIANEDKNATVILQATDGTVYPKVRIKVDFVSGPANPTIMAYDTNGTGFNIVEIGYWGPETGFAVGGTFKNETPVVATYPKAGTYVTRLSLLDLNNGNQVITSKEFTQTVSAATVTPPQNTNSTVNDIVDNVNNIVNNTVDEIPQTGTSILVYTSVIVVIIAVAFVFMKVKEVYK